MNRADSKVRKDILVKQMRDEIGFRLSDEAIAQIYGESDGEEISARLTSQGDEIRKCAVRYGNMLWKNRTHGTVSTDDSESQKEVRLKRQELLSLIDSMLSGTLGLSPDTDYRIPDETAEVLLGILYADSYFAHFEIDGLQTAGLVLRLIG